MGPNKFLSAQIMTKLEKKFSIYDNFSKKKEQTKREANISFIPRNARQRRAHMTRPIIQASSAHCPKDLCNCEHDAYIVLVNTHIGIMRTNQIR